MTRDATPRRYLMCAPAHFKVTYSINPWMDPSKPVDLPLANTQWEDLRDRFRSLGHTVELLTPDPDLPDMVFAANGATVIDGRVLGALFAYRERYAEAEAHRDWFRANGFTDIHVPDHVNEGRATSRSPPRTSWRGAASGPVRSPTTRRRSSSGDP